MVIPAVQSSTDRLASVIDFSPVYSNQVLSRELNGLERSFKVIDEQEKFENLVNTSVSKLDPYYGWARYREGYSGALVQELIHRSNLDPKNHFTFDPMCGSGSTLVASGQLGFDSVGCDINPYSVDLTNAKVHHYTTQLREVEAFIQKAFPQANQLTLHTWRSVNDCRPYFRASHLEQLQLILDAIKKVRDRVARHLLFIGWLAILEDCSEKKKDGNGLASDPSRVVDVWNHYVKQIRIFLKDIREHPLPKNVVALARKQTALNSAVLAKEFQQQVGKELGAIIFSPPYANSFDYFESYKLELLCGYYTSQELIEARKEAIRNYRKGYGYDLTTNNQLVHMLCEEIRARIPQKEAKTGRLDNRSRLVPNLLIGYFEDMEAVIRQFSVCMPHGSSCYIVVDQSSYLGIIIPTDLLLADIAVKNGFEIKEIILCRSARTSVQQLMNYPYLKTMLRESIIFLKKV